MPVGPARPPEEPIIQQLKRRVSTVHWRISEQHVGTEMLTLTATVSCSQYAHVRDAGNLEPLSDGEQVGRCGRPQQQVKPACMHTHSHTLMSPSNLPSVDWPAHTCSSTLVALNNSEKVSRADDAL